MLTLHSMFIDIVEIQWNLKPTLLTFENSHSFSILTWLNSIFIWTFGTIYSLSTHNRLNRIQSIVSGFNPDCDFCVTVAVTLTFSVAQLVTFVSHLVSLLTKKLATFYVSNLQFVVMICTRLLTTRLLSSFTSVRFLLGLSYKNEW